MKKAIFLPGDNIGNKGIVFISELPPYKQPSGQLVRMGIFICSCGKEFESRVATVKDGRTSNCGCGAISGMQRHYLTHTKSRNCWARIKQKCLNLKHTKYKDYGARGITMYPEWIHDFKSFHDYVVSLPHYGEPGMTLDRKDNNGNYEPGNLRWATIQQQNTNKRNIKTPENYY